MKWTHQYGNCNIWRVTIPESEKVIEYNDKLKAKRIILTDCQPLYNNPELCKLVVQQDGHLLEFVKEQTPEICKLAVRQNGCALEYVKEQTPEICKLAVQQNPDAIKYVKNPEWVNEE